MAAVAGSIPKIWSQASLLVLLNQRFRVEYWDTLLGLTKDR